jgi:uncharacterized protein
MPLLPIISKACTGALQPLEMSEGFLVGIISQGVEESETGIAEAGQIQLPSGGFNLKQLKTILNTLPVDVTFVDANDTVRYFSQGKERIFDRNRAILGRKVQMCHPPSSVHVVEQIIDDFKSGQ